MHRPHLPSGHRQASPGSPSKRAARRPRLDKGELATGFFVAVALLLPRSTSGWYFLQAKTIILSTIFFEGAMALPAIFAYVAISVPARWRRVGLLALGTLGYLLMVAYWVVVGEAWLLIPQGLWILYGRMRRPRSVEAFSPSHCASIGYQAATGWSCYAVATILLGTVGALLQRPGFLGEVQRWFAAMVWGGFYVAMSMLMPRAQAWGLRIVRDQDRANRSVSRHR